MSDFVEIEDEHDIIEDEEEAEEKSEPEKITNEKFTKVESQISVPSIITTLVIAVSSVFFAFIAIAIVYKQYKKSTNPLNYKERNEGGSKRADEEFSEIRYLTSDEALDFALATPDNFTDL
jgi:cell division protein FtsL